jgi:hypothetical protein
MYLGCPRASVNLIPCVTIMVRDLRYYGRPGHDYYSVRQPAIDIGAGDPHTKEPQFVGKASRNVYQRKRVSEKSVSSRKTSVDKLVNTATKAERIFVKTKSLSLKSNFVRWYGDDKPESPILRCDSPVSMFPCDGFCRGREDGSGGYPVKEGAEVVCFPPPTTLL